MKPKSFFSQCSVDRDVGAWWNQPWQSSKARGQQRVRQCSGKLDLPPQQASDCSVLGVEEDWEIAENWREWRYVPFKCLNWIFSKIALISWKKAKSFQTAKFWMICSFLIVLSFLNTNFRFVLFFSHAAHATWTFFANGKEWVIPLRAKNKWGRNIG